MTRLHALTVWAALCMASPVAAGQVSDAIMSPGLFHEALSAETGTRLLHYSHVRKIPAQAQDGAKARQVIPLNPVTGGFVDLTRTAPGLALSLAEGGGQPHLVAEFNTEGPNPVLLFFLENVVRSTSAATGGSPYYIRNRIRDSLMQAVPSALPDGTVQVDLAPFAADDHRAQLGAFGGLRIRLRYDASDPGRLQMLDAQVDDQSYHETLQLENG